MLALIVLAAVLALWIVAWVIKATIVEVSVPREELRRTLIDKSEVEKALWQLKRDYKDMKAELEQVEEYLTREKAHSGELETVITERNKLMQGESTLANWRRLPQNATV